MAELTRSIFANPRFVGSYAKIDQTPSDSVGEIAFAGRSNAGKSSVLNALFNRKALVKVSSKPGKTRLLNFFETEKQHYIVDLPGYGYAAVSQSMQKEWGREMTRYLEERETLIGVVVVMDIRHPLSKMDMVMIDFLKENPDLRVHVLLNKSDKLKRGPAANTLRKTENQLKAIMRCSIQTFSAQKRDGVPILQKQLLQWFNEK